MATLTRRLAPRRWGEVPRLGPRARSVELVLQQQTLPLTPEQGGYFGHNVPGLKAGDRYSYRVDGRGPFPDPASRRQPDGVHAHSEIVDPRPFPWTDGAWRNRPWDELVIHELHIGTFTQEGTFDAARARLASLVDLGLTAVELMPLSDFPGRRNWGYDGVSHFAPPHCYGTPDDLRRLIDDAHRLGLAVLIDVVYNHLGPDGNYTGVYSSYYLSKGRSTPWGDGINLDGRHAEGVRHFFTENALHWLHEYHADGFRFDATQYILDDRPTHFLAELADVLRASRPDRPVHLVAEDSRNLAEILLPRAEGGWGFDGVWADDCHHQIRRILAGDREGYYQDYTESIADLAVTLEQGWFFTGQRSEFWGGPRGTDPAGLLPRNFVLCIQNHDQIGNRALGERLNHQIDAAAYRAATALLLCAPGTPMLFMGQEWAASSPFLFFTDHAQALGKRVTEGRRKEFRHFSGFTDPKARERIPDPQADATFHASQLKWDEVDREPHTGMRRLYQALLQLRQQEPALKEARPGRHSARAANPGAVTLMRQGDRGTSLLLACQLSGAGQIELEQASAEVILSTEETRFTLDARAPTIAGKTIAFARPGALLLRVPGT